MAATQSAHRLITYGLFAGLLLAGLALEKNFHEMHVSKLLCFSAMGAWARELAPPARWWLLGMVALLWGLVIVPWVMYPHQHLVPVGPGVYRIEQ